MEKKGIVEKGGEEVEEKVELAWSINYGIQDIGTACGHTLVVRFFLASLREKKKVREERWRRNHRVLATMHVLSLSFCMPRREWNLLQHSIVFLLHRFLSNFFSSLSTFWLILSLVFLFKIFSFDKAIRERYATDQLLPCRISISSRITIMTGDLGWKILGLYLSVYRNILLFVHFYYSAFLFTCFLLKLMTKRNVSNRPLV